MHAACFHNQFPEKERAKKRITTITREDFWETKEIDHPFVFVMNS